ncbi:hypothetical protein [Streptomyces sp. NPDC005012]|uniref:hypothetical protein n=1 Tax=Streptomyces sp. NPDC005012 TaxID=3154558 RepID=UPI0033A3083F
MAQTFADLTEQHGGRLIQPLLALYLRHTATSVLAEPPTSNTTPDLLTATAQLAHLLARATDDSGHKGLAQQYFRLSARLAANAADTRQYSIALRAMSSQALSLRHLPQAATLAEAAAHALGRHVDSTARAFVLVQRALTRALTGQRKQAMHDLNAAERHHERATNAPGPFGGYSRASLDYQRFRVLHALDDTKAALDALQSSASRRAPGERRALALTHARLAELHMSAGLIDKAVAHAEAFLGLYSYLHSADADAAHQHLQQSLARYPRHPRAAALYEQGRNAHPPAPASRRPCAGRTSETPHADQ